MQAITATKVRFAELTGSWTGYVCWSHNHLLQRRQFAFDGRLWFYQPDNRSKFRRVNPSDMPEAVWSDMANHLGITVDDLKQRTER